MRALARYVSPDAALSGAVAFSLGDADELRGLVEAAGALRLPPPEEFFLRHLSAMPRST